MKAIKVKFHNKRKKLHNKTQSHKRKYQIHDNQIVDFLLRQNTDTQQAKHELRKFSDEVYQHQQNQDYRYSWSKEKVGIPISWLDEMEDKKFNCSLVNKSLLNNCLGQNYGLVNSPNHEQLSQKIQARITKINQNIQKREAYMKKSTFLTSINLKQKQNARSDVQIFKNQRQQKILRIQTQNNKISSQEIKNSFIPYKNLSTNQLKNGKKFLVSSSKRCDQNEKQKNQQNKGVATIYFKVPQFNNNIKRSVTVHSETNASQANIKKSNFYLKKTKTICILQKPIFQTNKSISLSNCHLNTNKKKNRVISNPELKNKSPQATGDLQVIDKSYQNLKTSTKKINIEQTAKTMMLRQQFQRLRKLMKKQYKSEFKVDNDLPIKILKF